MFCGLQSKLAPSRQAPELCAVFSNGRRRTQEPFLLNRVLDHTQGTAGSSTCFEEGEETRALREECGILISAEAKGVYCEREGYCEVV
jgi:hypothetical protein